MRFSIHDWTGGYRAIRKEVFLKESKKIKEVKNYTFQISFLHHAVQDGFKVAEVPIHFTDRTMGNSKLTAKSYIIDVLKYCFVAKFKEIIYGPFGKFMVVGGTGFVIQAIILKVLVEYFIVNPTVANLVGAAVAIFSNFNLNNFWTFKAEKVHGIKYLWKLLNFYATSAVGVIVIQTGIIFLGDQLLGRKYYFLYFIAGTLVLTAYNFTMYRFVIWRKKPQ